MILSANLTLAFADHSETKTSALGSQPNLSAELIESELNNLKTDTSISDTDKKIIQSFYQTALEQLQAAEIFDTTAHSYQRLINDGGKNANAIRQQLKNLESIFKKPDRSNTDESAMTNLELQLQTDQARLQVLENGLTSLNHQLQQQIARPRQVHLAQQALTKKLNEIQKNKHFVSVKC